MSALWPQTPLTFTLAILIALGVMYLGRQAAHGAIRALCNAVRAGLAHTSELLMSGHERLVHRNREVMLEMGREAMERTLEREFHRVNEVVAGDLSGYPALNRQLADQIQRIDEDYRASTEVPPAPPEWTRAVEAIAQVPSHGDPMVARILEDVRKGLENAQKMALCEYRKASGERHSLLHRMLPYWRKLAQTIERVDGTIRGLHDRAREIDRRMEEYESIRQGSDDAVRMLASSSMTNFVTAAFVLFIAVMGGFINFHLIALPMSEMVGATSYVGPIRISDVAALVIIMTEIAMGFFLMESLGITRLFPVIHRMDDRMRKRMVWVSFGILFTLACVESSLAYMRDILAADREALSQQLAGVAVTNAQLRWIPSLGQMVMGFMLPFALAFAAIPFESFIHSSRVVLGSAAGGLLRLFSALFELLGGFVANLGPMLVAVYDFVIVVPLRLEQVVTRRGPATPPPAPDAIRRAGTLLVALAATGLIGCGASGPHTRAVYLLLDTSGTYSQEIDKARAIANYLLGTLGSGDSLGLARIDSASFSEKDIVARMTFDERPSYANQQKRAFRKQLDRFVTAVSGSAHTDITGGMMQAAEWLNETGAQHRYILVFSDLEEDLQKGYVRDFRIDLSQIHVVALNVTKLRSDQIDPREYMDRIDTWKGRVRDGAGTFRVMNDLDRLDGLLSL